MSKIVLIEIKNPCEHCYWKKNLRTLYFPCYDCKFNLLFDIEHRGQKDGFLDYTVINSFNSELEMISEFYPNDIMLVGLVPKCSDIAKLIFKFNPEQEINFRSYELTGWLKDEYESIRVSQPALYDLHQKIKQKKRKEQKEIEKKRRMRDAILNDLDEWKVKCEDCDYCYSRAIDNTWNNYERTIFRCLWYKRELGTREIIERLRKCRHHLPIKEEG